MEVDGTQPERRPRAGGGPDLPADGRRIVRGVVTVDPEKLREKLQ